jgi:hypothetical protein
MKELKLGNSALSPKLNHEIGNPGEQSETNLAKIGTLNLLKRVVYNSVTSGRFVILITISAFLPLIRPF